MTEIEKFTQLKGEITDGVLKNIVAEILLQKCKFCDGRGHSTIKCATKRKIDNVVKRLPLQRKLWGNYKSTLITIPRI
jgi:hypothetical protein